MPLALTGYEIGLLLVAAVFVAFALVAALVVPRQWPDFPSRRLGLFIAVCVALFLAQMTAVVALAELGEEEHPEAVGETQPGATQPTETEPGATKPTETETTTETAPPAEEGNPEAGKQVFLGPGGCGACHTLADAGTSGTVGPNLDEAKPSFELALDRVTNGKGAMPSFK
ncbi:MAG TPA: cytochrome c, partial [Gaiellaceae bacterium]|nr:cytochrome c [Gaiellaceae bacterium]